MLFIHDLFVHLLSVLCYFYLYILSFIGFLLAMSIIYYDYLCIYLFVYIFIYLLFALVYFIFYFRIMWS